MSDIIDDLLNLQKQANTEKTHFYTANLIGQAIDEILRMRKEVIEVQEKCRKLNEKN